jgi:predicted permease
MANLRIVLRSLARTPVFATVAILSLALGIGVNTAIFSLLDQLLLRTLPVERPEELVFLYSEGPWQGSYSADEGGGPSFSYPLFRELQAAQTPFVGLVGARNDFVSLAVNNQASHGSARMVSGNYFNLLGVRPAIGRLFTEDDDRTPGAHPLAVLSHAYWSSRFGAELTALNQTILVNNFPMTIVGVTQEGFLSERVGSPPDIYMPISMKEQITPGWEGRLSDRRNAWVTMFGRLKAGVTLERAELEINVAYRAQLEQDIQLLRQPKPDFVERFRAREITLQAGEHGRGGLRDLSRQPLLLLFAMTALVLLIACANVANLQLARGAARAREVAIRLAMGASRGQLIRQFLVESWILALAGGVLGIFAALWTLRAILANIPAGRGLEGFVSTNLDARVLLFCLGLSFVSGLLFGLVPALQASKADLATTLKDQAGQVSCSGSANAFRKTLVSGQVAISLLLLITAGLFLKTLLNLTHIDLGIRVDHLISFSLLPKLSAYTDERVSQLHDQLNARLSAIPGVSLVSTAAVAAVAHSTSRTTITIEGYEQTGEDQPAVNINEVGAGYFQTMGIPLITGREFNASDTAGSPPVAIVNEAFVRQYLPNQNPLGRHIDRSKRQMEIVGVVADANYATMRETPPATFYTPLPQTRFWYVVHFYLRTAVPPENTIPLIHREVAALDPNLPIGQMKTMEMQLEENMFAERILSYLAATFAGLATLLAAVGLYGVLAYNVERRTREIGIRMALGANAHHVRGLVVREVAMMLLLGTTAGLAAAAAASQYIQSILYGLEPTDTLTYGTAALAVWLVALGSAYVPARRATSVDPMEALRHE